jgi:hypothetical protein
MDGDYTGTILLGSKQKPANVILDTGSSTLSVDGKKYDPTKDSEAKITNIAQEVGYGDGSNWIGAVVQTDVGLGTGAQAAILPKANVAVAYKESASMFRNSDGILGLAYTKLNNAFTLPGPTLPPTYNYNQIQAGRVTYLEPYFTQLEDAGVIGNRFAFYTRRSMISLATGKPAANPLNKGFLILGGGEESTDLYTGQFQNVRVVDDEYYNTNLKAVIVGKSAPITVPAPTKSSGNASSSIVDSGTNSLTLDQGLFNAIVRKMSKADDQTLARAIRSGYVPVNSLKLANWPAITFVLEGDAGVDVKLTVTPDTYWQVNAPEKAYATAVLFGDGGEMKGQSILGLPLMNNYFTIFDRSVEHGLGAIKFAPIKRS